jgi:hypothetical protein
MVIFFSPGASSELCAETKTEKQRRRGIIDSVFIFGLSFFVGLRVLGAVLRTPLAKSQSQGHMKKCSPPLGNGLSGLRNQDLVSWCGHSKPYRSYVGSTPGGISPRLTLPYVPLVGTWPRNCLGDNFPCLMLAVLGCKCGLTFTVKV